MTPTYRDIVSTIAKDVHASILKSSFGSNCTDAVIKLNREELLRSFISTLEDDILTEMERLDAR